MSLSLLSTFKKFFRDSKFEKHYLEYYTMRNVVICIYSTLHTLFLLRYDGFGM